VIRTENVTGAVNEEETGRVFFGHAALSRRFQRRGQPFCRHDAAQSRQAVKSVL
jgi:hypothetical protein